MYFQQGNAIDTTCTKGRGAKHARPANGPARPSKHAQGQWQPPSACSGALHQRY